MSKIDPRVRQLCDEFGVQIVPRNAYPRPGETRAVWTIQRIIEKRGMDHARLALMTLAETANNHASLDESALWAASDLVKAYQPIIDQDASAWLSVWDDAPVGELQFVALDLRGIVKQRPALAGMMCERIVRRFGPRYLQPDLLDDRRAS